MIKDLESCFSFLIRFYGQDIRASAILLGDVPSPPQAEDLYEILASFTEEYENEEQKNNPGKTVTVQGRVCAFLSHRLFSLLKLFIISGSGNVGVVVAFLRSLLDAYKCNA